MGALGATPELDLVVLVAVGDAALGLDIALVHRLGIVFALDHHIGFGEAGLHVAHPEVEPLDDVGRRIPGALDALAAQMVVQDRRARLHRLDRVDHMRQQLVLDLDQLERALGDGLAGRGHRGDRMAVIEDLLARHDVARQIARRGAERELRKIVPGDHRLHPRQGFRRRNVDRLQDRVRVRAPEDLGEQHAGQDQIGAELGAPGDLVGPVLLDRVGADDLELPIGVEAALFENARHNQASLISAAAAWTERMTLS